MRGQLRDVADILSVALWCDVWEYLSPSAIAQLSDDLQQSDDTRNTVQQDLIDNTRYKGR